MYKFTALIIGITIFSACKRNYIPREKISLSFENHKLDSTSIRAIEILSDTSLYYAGSKGDYGTFSKMGVTNNQILYDTIRPHFRAISFTEQARFALSIGNPALLFKIQNDSVKLVYKEENQKVFYDAMRFFDAMNGIAIGDPTGNCLSIITTSDGGNTWNKVPCENLPEIKSGEAAFAASNTNIAIVGTNAWVATGGIHSRVYHTPDMGTTWAVYDTPIIQGKNTTGIYTIDFYNEKQGIICGGDYTDKYGNYSNKAISTDGGKTWKPVAINAMPKYVSCVQYIPNTEGKEIMAVSTNGVFYSYNSGNNWTKVSDDGYYSIRFVHKNMAYLSGDGMLAKMTIH